MIGSILTPTSIWKNFSIKEDIGAETICQKKQGDIIYTSLNIEGKSLDDGTVNIYAELARKNNSEKSPAILLMEDFSINPDKTLTKNLIKQGYIVFCVDIAGFKEGKEFYTDYPASIDYANYEKSKDNLFSVEKDAINTCWYEWATVLRYALKYLKSLDYVSKIGGLAISHVATALWHVAGVCEDLDSVVFAFNSGWLGYKEILKFGGMVEPQFNDDKYKFIAGIDPQSYAMHISCPVLMLSATNCADFDADRAYDSVSRINEGNYTALHYSVGQIDVINNDGFNDMSIFFDKFLNGKGRIILPKEIDLKCDIEDGAILIEGTADPKHLQSIEISISEGKANPALRLWKNIPSKIDKQGRFVAKYLPFNSSELVVMFATAKYENGFSISSNIIAKRFKDEEIEPTFKSNVIYSSRMKELGDYFISQNPSSFLIDSLDKWKIRTKKGPMGIEGITHENGILSFLMAIEKFKPSDAAILMLDVYSKNEGELVIKMIADYLGEKTEYVSRQKIIGGDVWHNVKIGINKFKTAEGLVLKEYSKIEAISINVENSDYLINNMLWI